MSEGGFVLPGVMAGLSILMLLTAGLMTDMAVRLEENQRLLDDACLHLRAENAFVRAASEIARQPSFSGFSEAEGESAEAGCTMQAVWPEKGEVRLFLKVWEKGRCRFYEGRVLIDVVSKEVLELFYHQVPGD